MANLDAGPDTDRPAADTDGARDVAGLFRDRYPEMVRLADLLGADDPEDIARVCNLTRNRHRHLRVVRGVVASGRGFPLRAWQVRYPVQYPATLLFYDAAGHQVSKLFIAANDQNFNVPRSGGIGLFRTANGTMTAYLVNGLITFWISDSWQGGFPAAG